jgi:hypothetical protein
MTPATSRPDVTSGTIRWGRIVGAAFLLELLLFVTLVPIGLVFGMPGVGSGTDFTVFFVAVPIGCFLGGYIVGAWLSKPLTSQRALHGALMGVAATLIYLVLGAVQPGGIRPVIAGYGVVLFWGINALRIAGAALGAAFRFGGR